MNIIKFLVIACCVLLVDASHGSKQFLLRRVKSEPNLRTGIIYDKETIKNQYNNVMIKEILIIRSLLYVLQLIMNVIHIYFENIKS